MAAQAQCERNAVALRDEPSFNTDDERDVVDKVYGSALEALSDEDRALPQVTTGVRESPGFRGFLVFKGPSGTSDRLEKPTPDAILSKNGRNRTKKRAADGLSRTQAERSTKLRNVLTVAGCDARDYWLGTLLGDLALLLVVALCVSTVATVTGVYGGSRGAGVR